jgi:vWA-MoxR associated protein C-terminal domain/Caspase domain
MADYALIVGIERYQTLAARPLQGPGFDALQFAFWLNQAQKVPADNIFLFLNRNGEADNSYQQVAGSVQAAGILVRNEPSRAAISKVWREDLLSGPEDQTGTLWLFWSGHGLIFPSDREAVLCADSDFQDPSFIYLAEFRDSFRSKTYRRFNRQRIVVDACAEYLTAQDLNIVGLRNPATWPVTETPELVELNAVAPGKSAVAEQGGSLFSRILLDQLKKTGWPDDPRDFHRALEQAILAQTGDESKLPRLRITSPRFEAGIDVGEHADECRRILEMLWNCKISVEGYQPHYLRTVGDLTSNPRVLSASTLTAMVRELLQLNRDFALGVRSLAMVEFLERVRREFKTEAKPIEEWLESVPAGALLSVREKLDLESSDLILSIVLTESAATPDGFPVSIHAVLADKNFSTSILSWDFPDLKEAASLEVNARLILNAADAQARRQKGISLKVQVFANPAMMGVPWHAYRLDPEDDIDCAAFGQLHPFVVRSRARLIRAQKYDLDSWKKKASSLRRCPCNQIPFAMAPTWSDEVTEEVNDILAKVQGLLLIKDTLDAPSVATRGLYKLLNAAFRRGLPLATWPIPVAGKRADAGADLAGHLKDLFGQCGSLDQTPEHFRDQRKSEPWARQVVFFWDDDDADKLLNLLGKEPSQ